MKHEPVLAKLNELRKDAQGEGGIEEKALYHMFCFISYQVGPFADFVEKEVAPSEKKDTAAGPKAEEYLDVLTELKEEVADDPTGHGIHRARSRRGLHLADQRRFSGLPRRSGGVISKTTPLPLTVIPAYAGIQGQSETSGAGRFWIPDEDIPG